MEDKQYQHHQISGLNGKKTIVDITNMKNKSKCDLGLKTLESYYK